MPRVLGAPANFGQRVPGTRQFLMFNLFMKLILVKLVKKFGNFSFVNNCASNNYFGLPNKRTCAFIYFSGKNRTCAGLLGTVRLFSFKAKRLENFSKLVLLSIF